MTIQCKNDFFSTKFTNEHETQTYLPTKDSDELVICVNMQGVQALFGVCSVQTTIIDQRDCTELERSQRSHLLDHMTS